jgi:hypothetical protein
MLSSLKKKLSSVQERTAARAALHGNIERENAAKEAAAAARKPFDKSHDQVEHAQALARAAQERLQAIDAAEAELAKSWPPRELTPEEKAKRREAEEDLARTVRTLRATEANARGSL